MKFHNNIFWSEELSGREEEIKKKISTYKTLWNIYVIVLSDTDGQLEFYHVEHINLYQQSSKDAMIVGVATGYSSALMLVKQMLDHVYEITGSCKIKNYFLDTYQI